MGNRLLDGFFLDDKFVDPLKGQVSDAGTESHLPSKSVEVLLFLASRPRRLVTREEFLAKVWGEGHGSADTLAHAVHDIRTLLGDTAVDPHFIQIVPTRGYRLLVEPRLKTGTDVPHRGLIALCGSES